MEKKFAERSPHDSSGATGSLDSALIVLKYYNNLACKRIIIIKRVSSYTSIVIGDYLKIKEINTIISKKNYKKKSANK